MLDSFELALASILGRERRRREVRKGIELVLRRARSACSRRRGLERIDADGEPFDPNEHEAVMQEDGDGEPVVGDVLRTGYTLKGTVLRPAMVKVTR